MKIKILQVRNVNCLTLIAFTSRVTESCGGNSYNETLARESIFLRFFKTVKDRSYYSFARYKSDDFFLRKLVLLCHNVLKCLKVYSAIIIKRVICKNQIEPHQTNFGETWIIFFHDKDINQTGYPFKLPC